LIGAYVQVQFDGGSQPVVAESPFLEDDINLPLLYDAVTGDTTAVLPGRININQAPRAVLMTVPGMTDTLADALIAQRDSAGTSGSTDFQYLLWPLARLQGTLTLAQFKPLLPYLSVGSDVHRAQVVGFLDNQNTFSRYEIVVDATGETARILSWKDLTQLGRGYSPAVLGGTAP